METNSEIPILLRDVISQVSQRIVGNHDLTERILVALLCNGHVLLEGAPGLAKTRMVSAFSETIAAKMARVQFTPDLLPSDILGTEVFRPQNGEFEIRKGPIFCNLLLADEINRAPAKVQAALLQGMQERQVTIGTETFKLPRPFMVLATQNPIEQEGTYRLPEAQLDRFLMKLKVDYPNFEDEVQILNQTSSDVNSSEPLTPILSISQLESVSHAAEQIHVDPKIDRYIVAIVQATRNPSDFGLTGMLDWGSSPRGSIALRWCSRALALVQGRDFVSPDCVKQLAVDVLRHRVSPSIEAEARGIDSDQIIRTILKSIPLP